MGDIQDTFPNLFRPYCPPDGILRMEFELGNEFPPGKIGMVKMVAYIGDDYLAIRLRDGWWEPGGKLEPGEAYLDAIHREMREEIGAKVLDFTLFGAFHCFSREEDPSTPGLLWPEFYFLWGYGSVEFIGPPQPTASENILEVAVAPLQVTCERLVSTPGAGPLLVDLYRLADRLRKNN